MRINFRRARLVFPVPFARYLPFAISLLLGASLANAQSGIALVQHRSKDAGTTSSSSLAFTSNNTAGNWIGVCIRAGRSGQAFSVSDSRGNTYHQAIQFNVTVDPPNGDTVGIFYAENIAGGANTITVSDTISGTLRFAILEYSGVALTSSLEATAVAQGTGTSPNTANTTTLSNGDLLLAAIMTGNGTNFTAGSGYTIEESTPAEPNTKLIAEDRIQTTAGNVSANASLGASNAWGAGLAAFKFINGVGGGPSITATAGTPQSATIGTVFATPLQATVKDAGNNPVNGATVTFGAPPSGASGTFAGGVNTATTNAQGVATAPTFTANSTAGGPYIVTASVGGAATPANFSLTNLAGAPASITATAGTPQSATIGTAFATSLQATVKDAGSNPVNGATVTFAAPANGASGTFAGGVNTATTNAQGVATAPTFTANNTVGGPYNVSASVTGVASPANFALTNLAGAPASITATAGTAQSATISTAFATPLQATVKDAANNPLGGVTVTFGAPASGASGTFAGGVNTATTNAQGVATAPVFTANSTAGGPYNVSATVSGVATPANFALTNLAGAPASITATAGTPQSATIGTAFATPLQATVKDAGNNPVNGATVTFAAPANGASGTFAGGVNTATTNAQGMATAPTFTANSTAGGPYIVAASVGGVATQANFSLTNLAVSTGGIALVQHKSKDAGTTSSTSLAFNSNNTAGNWIGVCIRAGRSGQVFSITDSLGNKYQPAIQFNVTVDPPNGDTLGIFYAENIAGGANSITVSDTILGTLRVAILEYSGVALTRSLDATAVAQGRSTSPGTVNTTTFGDGDLLLGAIMTGGGASFIAGSGYQIEESSPAEPGTKLIAEDQRQTVAGAASASASIGVVDNWGAGMAAFRSISAGPPPPISVNVSPSTASVAAGSGAQGFTATLQNDFFNKGVTWGLSGAGCSGATCGTLSNSTTTSVTYTGPPSVPSPATVTLTATSVTDNAQTGTATITVILGPLAVAVSPKRAAVTLSQAQQFTASVFNDPQNGGVIWSVDGNNGGNATTGTITAAGLFTPGSQAGQHTVTATSVTNGSASASVMIAVTDLPGVLTHHVDKARTGQNLQEYGLTPTTVNSSTFGKLFSCPVDGFVYAEPLYVANLAVGGVTHNVVYIATEHDSVYAFDADSPSCTLLWRLSFLLNNNVTTVLPGDVGGTSDLIPEIGITSTPAIDLATSTIYVESKTKETVGIGCSVSSPCFFQRLHALDLSTGLVAGIEKFGGPAVISAPNFDSRNHLQRPALLLANGTVYIGFGSHGDHPNWQGWMFGYDAATMSQKFVWSSANPTSGNGGGGIWGGGAGPALDAAGNVYFSTGNGRFNANSGGTEYGDSTVKMSPSGSVLDYFTPFNQSTFDANDIDLGSANVLILPDSVGPHMAIATGKVGILYLLDQTNLGNFHSGSNMDLQEVIPVPPPNTTNFDGGIFGSPAYWNGNIYVTGVGYPMSQYSISNGVIATPAKSVSSNRFPLRGAIPMVSANGTSGGILWTLDLTGWQTNQPAILDAYDATDLTKLLYSSPSSGSSAAGACVKFTVPTVANGKVYVGGQSVFTVFGLLPN